MRGLVLRPCGLAVLALLGAGCPKHTPEAESPVAAAGAPAGTPTAVELNRSTTPEGLTRVEIDLDGDQKPEIINFTKARSGASDLVVRKDVDLNRDGRIDVRSVFDEAGLRVEEHMDTDFDGRADWVDHYLGGKRSFSEVDTDFDGTFDLFKYFEGGVVRRKERDTNRDGRIDFWEYLDEGGKVVKTGRDVDGDGKMDVRQ